MSSTAPPARGPPRGYKFTPTYHTKPSPSIDPTKVKLPSSFTVLITGAGKGIGAHIALAYAHAGAAAIIITSRTISDLNAVSAEIKTISPTTQVLCIVCDMTNESQVQAMAAQVRANFTRLDVLINNAGRTTNRFPDPSVPGGERFPIGVLEGSTADFQDAYNLNFYGTYFAIRYLMPFMVASEDGTKAIVNVVSSTAQSATSHRIPVAYNVSKFAVCRLTEHVDWAHGRGKDGVVCFALHPGAVVTSLTRDAPPVWDKILVDDVDLCGHFCVWLTKEKREWLSGRYVMANWDVEELEAMKDDIVKHEKLKFTMDV